MVRIEFGTLSITEKDADGRPAVGERHQLTMTPKTFLETFGNMERMLAMLIDNGIVKERDADEQRAGPARDDGLTIDGTDRRGTDRCRRRIDPRD
ncbi:MAG: hypothetical protein VW405_10170 [Rhodospirillaceae bacterium]